VLTASANFGAFIGCLLSLVAIHFSYRRTIIVLDCLLISGSFLEMSENLYIFLAGRVIAGIGAGLHSVIVPLFIKMIAPK
jgi:predicted MFS family arabinose efflux permease